MLKIRVKSIEFGEIPFRRLRRLKIDIAPRITLISGHNGIGKSTILGLLANSSGYTGDRRKREVQPPKSYFGKEFQANLKEIIFIDYQQELVQVDEARRPRPIITYAIGRDEELQKRCGLTERSNSSEARIVARNFKPSSSEFISQDGMVKIGDSSKVPLPTLYLGMTRILPLGEAQKGAGYNEALDSMADEDKTLLASFINGVILGVGADKTSVTSNRIKNTSKFSSHPRYAHDAKSVSLGQDSLGSIAGAIASFQMLKREWPSYPGGLLIIDELDVGFHPHAIFRLVQQLEKYADELDLQIVATTHSTKLIEAVFPNSGKKSAKNAVAYLKDTQSPYIESETSLEQILADMELRPPTAVVKKKKPELRVYLEDDEAKALFDVVVPKAEKTRLGREYGISIKPFALGVGCDSLARLTSIDSRFASSIFVLDADARPSKHYMRHKNLVLLPGGNGESPERTLFNFMNSLVDNMDEYPNAWKKLREIGLTSDQIREYMIDTNCDVSSRKSVKKWWRDRAEYIKDWKLLELWLSENLDGAEAFNQAFSEAIRVVRKRLLTELYARIQTK